MSESYVFNERRDAFSNAEVLVQIAQDRLLNERTSAEVIESRRKMLLTAMQEILEQIAHGEHPEEMPGFHYHRLDDIARDLVEVAAVIGTPEQIEQSQRMINRMAMHHIRANKLEHPCIIEKTKRVLFFLRHWRHRSRFKRHMLTTIKKLHAIIASLKPQSEVTSRHREQR